ncbi:ferric reductase [Roseovarius aquimarinus]|uniref:Ferric reductase n=1 Tax=Roseovarius aquimarinus TaxID=1229156 RepID=A0ABW7I5R8_9RHOB
MRPAFRNALWVLAVCVIPVSAGLSLTSPLLQWRSGIYIAAGFAGVVAMCLLAVQPLLAAGYLPGLSRYRMRRVHGIVGALLIAAIAVHVGGLWLTSPPDVVDALTFSSPTPFSDWGVIAMWAALAAALLVALRRRLGMQRRVWRPVHAALAGLTVGASAAHAMLIDGTMESISKAALCALAVVVTVAAFADLGVWRRGSQRGANVQDESQKTG